MDEEKPSADLTPFPANRIVRFDANLRSLPQYQTKEDYDKLRNFRRGLVYEFISHIAPMVFSALHNAGFNTLDISKSKNAAMIIESIKAYMEKDYGLEHPFHEIAEAMFEVDEQSGKLILNSIINEEEEEEENETVNVGNSEESIESTEPE